MHRFQLVGVGVHTIVKAARTSARATFSSRIRSLAVHQRVYVMKESGVIRKLCRHSLPFSPENRTRQGALDFALP